ncbi:MAG: hypothetical protein HYY50_02195 [Candidatus Kerfeldbacteria bacterium]|nr:hypothetical protein [Candidatus Kerfeldbacteria bacterium]
MKRLWLWLIPAVGLLAVNGCHATTGAVRTTTQVSYDGVNGFQLRSNFTRRVIDSYQRSLGPVLYWNNPYGGAEVVWPGRVIDLTTRDAGARFSLVLNCNPSNTRIWLDHREVGPVRAGAWDFGIPNERTNAPRVVVVAVACENDSLPPWTLDFIVQSSAPPMDRGGRYYRRY